VRSQDDQETGQTQDQTEEDQGDDGDWKVLYCVDDGDGNCALLATLINVDGDRGTYSGKW